MKNLCFIFCFLFLAFGCESENSLLHQDDNGYSDFFVKNQTSESIILVGLPDSTRWTVSPNTQIQLYEQLGGGIGIHAFPSNVFTSLNIYLSNQPDSLVYQQEPIDNNSWQHQTPSGFAWWEYGVYTLIITSDSLR